MNFLGFLSRLGRELQERDRGLEQSDQGDEEQHRIGEELVQN